VTEIVKGAAKRQQQLWVDSFGRVTAAHFQKNWLTAGRATVYMFVNSGTRR
jgi:hypothetical protein